MFVRELLQIIHSKLCRLSVLQTQDELRGIDLGDKKFDENEIKGMFLNRCL